MGDENPHIMEVGVTTDTEGLSANVDVDESRRVLALASEGRVWAMIEAFRALSRALEAEGMTASEAIRVGEAEAAGRPIPEEIRQRHFPGSDIYTCERAVKVLRLLRGSDETEA